LILQIPEQELSRVLGIPPEAEVITEANKLLNEMAESFSLKRFGSSSDDDKKQLLVEIVRAHTVSVRNEGYPTQIRCTIRDLADALNPQFEQANGISLSALADMLWNVCALIDKRVNNDLAQRQNVLSRKSTAEIVNAFLKLHCPDNDKSATQFRANVAQARLTLQDLRSYITQQWDRGNFRLFYISMDEMVSCYPGPVDRSKLEEIVLLWSLELGSLAVAEPEHFFLDNPIWSSPLMRIRADRFFLPVPGLIQSFGEHLLERVIQTDAKLWDKYQSKIRPAYLERSTANLFSLAVPSAKLLRGVRWTEPKSGQRYETDVLVIIDGHVLVIECKAGRLTHRAKRGDKARLTKDLGRLIEEPTLQGQRFAQLLSSGHGPIEVEDSTGARHVLEPAQVLRISRINVTLDYLGPVGVQARLLREIGVVSKDLEPAATFHLHELQEVVEILDQPAFLLHYLHRRAELETAHDLLAGEEDLLALYLATGFDLGELENGEIRLAIPAMGNDLRPYFMGKELDRPVPKPTRRLTGWWKDILCTLQRRQTYGWMEICYTLLCVGHVRQKEFERFGKKVLKNVKSHWRDPKTENACFLIAGSPIRRIKVMYVAVKNVTLTQQRDAVARAISTANDKVLTPATVVIVKSASTDTYPYSAVYLFGPDYEKFLRGTPAASDDRTSPN